MKKIENFIDKNFETLVSIKTLSIMCLIVFAICISICNYHLTHKIDDASRYIEELEKYVEANGGLMDTVGEGDAYTNWYNY